MQHEVLPDKILSLLSELENHYGKLGFEFQPFKIGWYNSLVQPIFKLNYDDDTVSFLIISAPRMFENAFIPFLKQRDGDLSGLRDPIDQCMIFYLSKICQFFPNFGAKIVYDFELHPNRRPKIVMQTVAHASGAAYFYHPQVIGQQENSKKVPQLFCFLTALTLTYHISSIFGDALLKQKTYRRFELRNGRIQLESSPGFNRSHPEGNERDLVQNNSSKLTTSDLRLPYFSQHYSEKRNLSSEMFIPSNWAFLQNNNKAVETLKPGARTKHYSNAAWRNSSDELSHSGKNEDSNMSIPANMNLNVWYPKNTPEPSIYSETLTESQSEKVPLILITLPRSHKTNHIKRDSLISHVKTDSLNSSSFAGGPRQLTITDTDHPVLPSPQDSTLIADFLPKTTNYNWRPISRNGVPLHVENSGDRKSKSINKSSFINNYFVPNLFPDQHFKDTDIKNKYPSFPREQDKYSNHDDNLQRHFQQTNGEMNDQSGNSNYTPEEEKQHGVNARQYSHNAVRHAYTGTVDSSLQRNHLSDKENLSRVYIPVTAIFIPTNNLFSNNSGTFQNHKTENERNKNASNTLNNVYIPYSAASINVQNIKTNEGIRDKNTLPRPTNNDISLFQLTHMNTREKPKINTLNYILPKTHNREVSIFKSSSESLFHRKPIMNSNSYETPARYLDIEKQPDDSYRNHVQHHSILNLKSFKPNDFSRNPGYVYFPDEITGSYNFIKNNTIKSFENDFIDKAHSLEKESIIPEQNLYQTTKPHSSFFYNTTSQQQSQRGYIDEPKAEGVLPINLYSDQAVNKGSSVGEKSNDAYYISWMQNVPFNDPDLNKKTTVDYNNENANKPEISFVNHVLPQNESVVENTQWDQNTAHHAESENEFSNGKGQFGFSSTEEPQTEVYNSFDSMYSKLAEHIQKPQFSFIKPIYNITPQNKNFPMSGDNQNYRYYDAKVEDDNRTNESEQLDALKGDANDERPVDKKSNPSDALLLVLLVRKATYPTREETKIIKQYSPPTQ
ncbi:uncharacterized protein MAL13P1.304 isoform X2 [Parasteatoda tepidariorum]|uniref:uncharacterized protein MAL13P1.304 isoform X2 n=1 Tax=Parasteatoda tepidariorum TaxID=114398 RepID=UPI00077FE2BE|nr:uncharacterized protein LOC107448792 isoform X2 [Parasteatoda tepidariorum]